MSEITLGILGGGQLGSMLSVAAKKLNIRTIIYCDDSNAPAQSFCDEFIFAKYDEKATWIDQLEPAFGEKEFFFEKEYKEIINSKAVKEKQCQTSLV